MTKESGFRVTGKVVDVLPGNKYRVILDNAKKSKITCYLSGKMRRNKIRVILGDTVEIVVSPYDLTQGRVVKRK